MRSESPFPFESRLFDSPILRQIEQMVRQDPHLTLVTSIPTPIYKDHNTNPASQAGMNGLTVYTAAAEPTLYKLELDSYLASFIETSGLKWTRTNDDRTNWFPHAYTKEVVGKKTTTTAITHAALPGTLRLLKNAGIDTAIIERSSRREDITRRIDLYVYPLRQYAELIVGVWEGIYQYTNKNIWDLMRYSSEERLQLLQNGNVSGFAQLHGITGEGIPQAAAPAASSRRGRRR